MFDFGNRNQPQVIDPRAAYEQQSILADQMLQRSQQYTGGGGLEALAMMLNAYGARKAGNRAEGALSQALAKEQEAARAAAEAEARAAQDEREFEMRKLRERIALEAANRAPNALIEQFQAAGIDPSSPEARRRILEGTGPQTTVTVGGEQQQPYLYGSDAGLPPGWRINAQTGEASMIPGGPIEQEQRQEAEAAQRRTGEQELSADIVLDELAMGRDILSQNPRTATGNVGLLGAVTNLGPGQDLQSVLNTIKPNIAFDRLSRMRQNSPTGGAVGQLSDSEREALAAVFGSLEQDQRAETLDYRMARLQNLYLDAVHGNRRQREEAVRSGKIDPATNQQIESLYIQDIDSLRPGGQREGRPDDSGNVMDEFERRAARYRNG